MQENNNWRKCNDCEIDITGLDWRLTRCQPCRDRKYIYQHGKDAFEKRKKRLCFVCLKSISDIHLKYNTCHECRKKRPRKKQSCILCAADITNKKMNAKYCDACYRKKKKKVRKCKKCGVIVERRLKTLCDSCEYKRDHVICPKCGKERYVKFAKKRGGERCGKCAERKVAKKQKNCKRCGDLVVPQIVGKVYCDRCAYERLHPVCLVCGKRIGKDEKGDYHKVKRCRPCYFKEIKNGNIPLKEHYKICGMCRRPFRTVKMMLIYCSYCTGKRAHCKDCGKKFNRVHKRKTGKCKSCFLKNVDMSIKDPHKHPSICEGCGRGIYKECSNQKYCLYCKVKKKHFADRTKLPQGMI